MNKDKKIDMIREFCPLCNKKHIYIRTKTFVEECLEEGYEHKAFWIVKKEFREEDKKEMLEHRINYMSNEIEKEVKEMKAERELEKQRTNIKNNNLIPIYFSKLDLLETTIERMIYVRNQFIRELEEIKEVIE